ncbi:MULTISPECIES: cytochrome c [unclassified Psychrobacter]|uniref:c-type cytochrome n=1 Tax=unclassified Psychrobacter TaxID=196806 RepID=UPI0025B5F5E4|nr:MULTISPECIES: cytochrome c [unclassified Psychrobacter]MDN3453021.1 cytochrome c [Psychrobacter sp. APC 3350]MDN3501415.1 cytochrome c [Psychrobacter sp. 5A.1]
MAQVYTNKSLKSIFGIALMTAALGLTACSTSTESNPDVEARQNNMKNWGDAMGVMGDMAKAPDTFDAAVFKEQAAFLAEDAANPWGHFADKAAVGNATEAVWSNADGFRAEADNFQKVTAELNAAAQTATSMDDVKPAFGQVGASCKSCHTDFKAKTD